MRALIEIGLLLVLSLPMPMAQMPSQAMQPAEQITIFQSSTEQYVTLLPKTPPGPSPWIVSPTKSTIWVAEIGTPPASQIREFFVNGTAPIVAVNLPGVIVSAIMPDPANPSGKLWFTENSTLSSYQVGQTGATNVTTFHSQSIQYLASDSQHRIWMTAVGSSGASNIIMYNPFDRSNSTYQVPTNNAIIQGLTIAGDDTIWFAEAGSKKIGHLIASDGQPKEYSPPSSISLSAPIQVALDSSGNVWFTDHGSNQFGVLDPGTNKWKVFPIGYCPDNCLYGLPNAIFVDSKNTVWFSEHIAGRVGHFDPSTMVLTEYTVPGNSTPLMWWAMPGPNNLVWFVAWASNQIGYVNASLPVPVNISSPSTSVVVQRGFTTKVPVTVSSQSATTISFGVFPVTQDQAATGFPAQIYGSSPADLTINGNSQTVSFGISAAWNATLGPRYVMLTASLGQVNLNSPVLVTVVEASAPVILVAFSSVIALGGLASFLRKPKKAKR